MATNEGMAQPSVTASKPLVTEILPKTGLVYSEQTGFMEALCKPKLIPIKSPTLEKLEKLAKEASTQSTAQRDTTWDSNDNRQ